MQRFPGQYGTLSPLCLQGSSYRGDCIPQEGGGCALIGRAIRAHINGNALYHIGDPSFLSFVEEVSDGEWKHWPFDLAMLKEVQESWPEPRFRQNVHLLQLVDWIRNYGPYPVSARRLGCDMTFSCGGVSAFAVSSLDCKKRAAGLLLRSCGDHALSNIDRKAVLSVLLGQFSA